MIQRNAWRGAFCLHTPRITVRAVKSRPLDGKDFVLIQSLGEAYVAKLSHGKLTKDTRIALTLSEWTGVIKISNGFKFLGKVFTGLLLLQRLANFGFCDQRLTRRRSDSICIFINYTRLFISRGSSVGIVTKLRTGRSRNSESISGRYKRLFLLTNCPDRFQDAFGFLLLRPGSRFLEVKRLEGAADHRLTL